MKTKICSVQAHTKQLILEQILSSINMYIFKHFSTSIFIFVRFQSVVVFLYGLKNCVFWCILGGVGRVWWPLLLLYLILHLWDKIPYYISLFFIQSWIFYNVLDYPPTSLYYAFHFTLHL